MFWGKFRDENFQREEISMRGEHLQIDFLEGGNINER